MRTMMKESLAGIKAPVKAFQKKRDLRGSEQEETGPLPLAAGGG